MKKTSRFLAFIAWVIFVSLFPIYTASAQPQAPPMFQRGFHFGVFGGYTMSPDASWENYDAYYDLNVKKTGIVGFKFGYTPPPIRFFTFEFEYSYLKPDVEWTVLSSTGSDYAAVEGDAELHNFMWNVIFKYPEGKIHPYFGIGVGASYFDLSIKSTSYLDAVTYRNITTSDDTVFAWQMLAGVDIDLTNNLSLDLGCRYFDTERLDNDSDYDDRYYDRYHNHDHHYHATLDFSTFMVTLGLKFRF